MEEEDPGSKFCSNCKKYISSTVFLLHEPHCRRNIVLCDQCGEAVPRTLMEEHKQEHEEVPCQQCRTLVPRGDMEIHLGEECPERMVICSYCKLEVKAFDLPEHSEACGSRTDVCDKCNQRVLLKYMEDHHDNYCGKAIPEPSSHRHRLLPAQDQLPAYHHLYPPGGSHVALPSNPTRYEDQQVPEFNKATETDLSGQPSEVTAGPSLVNPTMVIDQDWVGSVANALGEDNLDSMLAENISYETSRRLAVSDRRFLQEEQEHQHVADHELARRLQLDYDIHTSYTSSDASLAQQLQGEEDAIPTNLDSRSEHYARQLQEQENDHVVRVSEEQYDERQRKKEEMERQMKEDEELALRLQEEEKLRFQRPFRSYHPPSYRLDDGEDEEQQHGHTGGLTGSGHHQQTHETSAHDDDSDNDATMELAEEDREERAQYTPISEPKRSPSPKNKNFDEITDIPCDLCGAAVPFEGFSKHLEEEHNRDASDPYLAPKHHYHGYHYHNPQPYQQQGPDYYPASSSFHARQSSSSSSSPSPSPSPPLHLSPHHSPHLHNTSSMSPEPSTSPMHNAARAGEYVQCRHCHQHLSVLIVPAHEAICDLNPDMHLKDVNLTSSSTVEQPRPQTPPLLQPEADDPLVNHPFVETKIPCEFCKQPFPLSVFSDHQQSCTKRYGSLAVFPQSSPPGAAATAAMGGEDDEEEEDAPIPCEHCGELMPMTRLLRHQALCAIKMEHKSSKYQAAAAEYPLEPPNTAHSSTEEDPHVSIPPFVGYSMDLPSPVTHEPPHAAHLPPVTVPPHPSVRSEVPASANPSVDGATMALPFHLRGDQSSVVTVGSHDGYTTSSSQSAAVGHLLPNKFWSQQPRVLPPTPLPAGGNGAGVGVKREGARSGGDGASSASSRPAVGSGSAAPLKHRKVRVVANFPDQHLGNTSHLSHERDDVLANSRANTASNVKLYSVPPESQNVPSVSSSGAAVPLSPTGSGVNNFQSFLQNVGSSDNTSLAFTKRPPLGDYDSHASSRYNSLQPMAARSSLGTRETKVSSFTHTSPTPVPSASSSSVVSGSHAQMDSIPKPQRQPLSTTQEQNRSKNPTRLLHTLPTSTGTHSPASYGSASHRVLTEVERHAGTSSRNLDKRTSPGVGTTTTIAGVKVKASDRGTQRYGYGVGNISHSPRQSRPGRMATSPPSYHNQPRSSSLSGKERTSSSSQNSERKKQWH